jgi:hypothetical protein
MGHRKKMSDNLPQTIGIDISKASLDCHAHPAGTERQFANTTKGHKALIAWLRQWPVERIAYEATGTYHRALEAALADWACVKLNPERARRFAQATGTLAKTDRIDAMLLARMAATLRPPIRPARSTQQAHTMSRPARLMPPAPPPHPATNDTIRLWWPGGEAGREAHGFALANLGIRWLNLSMPATAWCVIGPRV